MRLSLYELYSCSRFFGIGRPVDLYSILIIWLVFENKHGSSNFSQLFHTIILIGRLGFILSMKTYMDNSVFVWFLCSRLILTLLLSCNEHYGVYKYCILNFYDFIYKVYNLYIFIYYIFTWIHAIKDCIVSS